MAIAAKTPPHFLDDKYREAHGIARAVFESRLFAQMGRAKARTTMAAEDERLSEPYRQQMEFDAERYRTLARGSEVARLIEEGRAKGLSPAEIKASLPKL